MVYFSACAGTFFQILLCCSERLEQTVAEVLFHSYTCLCMDNLGPLFTMFGELWYSCSVVAGRASWRVAYQITGLMNVFLIKSGKMVAMKFLNTD